MSHSLYKFILLLIIFIFKDGLIKAMEDNNDSKIDLNLRLGPFDPSKGSHVLNDEQEGGQQEKVGTKRKRFNATQVTMNSHEDLVQKAMREGRSLTLEEREEFKLEKKRRYMREKKRKIEEMVSSGN